MIKKKNPKDSNRKYLIQKCLELEDLNFYSKNNKNLREDIYRIRDRLSAMNIDQLREYFDDQFETLTVRTKYVVFDNECLVRENIFMKKILEEEED
jgi:hypothetical protein